MCEKVSFSLKSSFTLEYQFLEFTTVFYTPKHIFPPILMIIAHTGAHLWVVEVQNLAPATYGPARASLANIWQGSPP